MFLTLDVGQINIVALTDFLLPRSVTIVFWNEYLTSEVSCKL